MAEPSRIKEIPENEMTAEQKKVFTDLVAGRGKMLTPYKIWIHSPRLAAALETIDTFGWAKWITPLISGAIYFTVTMILLGVGKAYYAHYQAQRSPKPSAPAYTITMENPGQHRRSNEAPLTFSMPAPR